MLPIANTIVPIFAIILLGLLIRSLSFLPCGLVSPLNRLVYYLAIPAMVFREIAKASFAAHFDAYLILGTLIPVLLVFAIAFLWGLFLAVPRIGLGSFLQSSFHGNLGYIGLAVAYYFLGRDGLASASILTGFLLLIQNFLAVVALQMFSEGSEKEKGMWYFSKKIFGNPIILSCMAGMTFSLLKIPIPEMVDRSLGIVGGMALPLALLVMGAAISFRLIQSYLSLILRAGFLKLVALPTLGLLLYKGFGLPPTQYLPGLILLGTPTATVTYVMAMEMKGSPQFASGAISMSTLLSSVTLAFWLGLTSYG